MRESERLRLARAHLDELRSTVFANGKLGGPWLKVFLEGWALVGFRAALGHYWRRRPDDRLLSLCGLWHQVQYTIKGQSVIFEVGNFDKCSKCLRKRQRVVG